jgi:STE24 endopeptidase
MRRWWIALLLGGAVTLAGAVAPPPAVPAAAQAVPLDPAAATDAWIATQDAAQRAKTDAYYEGGYWIELWGAIVAVASAGLLLASGASRRLREAAERAVRARPLQLGLYGAGIAAAFALLGAPFSIYTDFVREHQYGFANQSFGPWLGDAAIGLAITLVVAALATMAIYRVIRAAPRTWWLWGALVAVGFAALGALVYPVYLAPLFNDYKPVSDPQVRAEVLSLARAYGVPAVEVYEFNASKQHKRISANVAGLGGTMRIALNDNLLNRASMAEIRMVMSHEIGHYVLNHIWKRLVLFGLVLVAMFVFAQAVFGWVHRRWGARWGVRDVPDVAGLPILVAAFTVFQLLATPVNNTITRAQEIEADRFGLAASREPDGFAAAALKLGEYRKMEPGPIEEAVFFTHPSGRHRIENAMRWKAEAQRGAAPSR